MQIFGTLDDATRAQLAKVAERARKVALMADGHVGYVMPIGGVAAYDNAVSVVGVGFDIACGNAAIRTDLTLSDIGDTNTQRARRRGKLADENADTLSFGMGRKNRADDAPTDDPLFEDAAWQAVPPKHRQALQVKARQQLGTVGSGNHYVDVFAGSGWPERWCRSWAARSSSWCTTITTLPGRSSTKVHCKGSRRADDTQG